MNHRKTLLLQLSVVSTLSLISLSYWEFIQIPETEKLSEYYTLDHQYVGENQVVSNVYGELSAPFLIKDTLLQDIAEKNGNTLTIHSVVSSQNSETGTLLFFLENTYHVDAISRKHIDRDGKFFAFPTNVEKKDYDFFHPAVFFDDPMKYVRTDNVHDLEVYVFETVTTDADISQAFSQFAPHTIHTDTTSRLWIEPTTGHIIRLEKTWENYLVENGERINTIEIGNKKSSEFTEHVFAELTESTMKHMYFNNFVMPILLLTLILIGGSLWILYSYVNKLHWEKIQTSKKEKLKDELVTMLSHENRNPLSSMKMVSELLLLEKDGSLNENQKKKVQLIFENAVSLSELVDDFSDVKKLHLEHLKLFKTEVDLKDYLENVIESIRPFTAEKNIRLSLDLKKSWKITCDQKRISQVLSNLVKNAIDFVPSENGKIVISAELSKDGTVISVTDNGVGISSSSEEIIFEKFQQLESPSNIKHEGSGLGLSICKGIVEAHGGRIWLDTNYTQGARFQFLIP